MRPFSVSWRPRTVSPLAQTLSGNVPGAVRPRRVQILNWKPKRQFSTENHAPNLHAIFFGQLLALQSALKFRWGKDLKFKNACCVQWSGLTVCISTFCNAWLITMSRAGSRSHRLEIPCLLVKFSLFVFERSSCYACKCLWSHLRRQLWPRALGAGWRGAVNLGRPAAKVKQT